MTRYSISLNLQGISSKTCFAPSVVPIIFYKTKK
jgi:hypothetical protein